MTPTGPQGIYTQLAGHLYSGGKVIEHRCLPWSYTQTLQSLPGGPGMGFASLRIIVPAEDQIRDKAFRSVGVVPENMLLLRMGHHDHQTSGVAKTFKGIDNAGKETGDTGCGKAPPDGELFLHLFGAEVQFPRVVVKHAGMEILFEPYIQGFRLQSGPHLPNDLAMGRIMDVPGTVDAGIIMVDKKTTIHNNSPGILISCVSRRLLVHYYSMLVRNKITTEHLDFAIANGEFPREVLEAAPLVACIMTQSWCPQWVFMRSWLKQLEKSADTTEGLNIHTFEAEYDKMSNLSEFRTFKEQVWNNWEVPYIRYYSGGNLIHESNFVSAMMFLDNLKNQ